MGRSQKVAHRLQKLKIQHKPLHKEIKGHQVYLLLNERVVMWRTGYFQRWDLEGIAFIQWDFIDHKHEGGMVLGTPEEVWTMKMHTPKPMW